MFGTKAKTKMTAMCLLAAMAVSGAPAAACADPGAHDIKKVKKTEVVRTYKLPRDSRPWQYRVIRTHRRVYGCGYAGGQGKKGIYLTKGQRLFVTKNPKNGPTVTAAASFSYAGIGYSVSVKIPLGNQGSKTQAMAQTYNSAPKKGYYKAYSHIVYDVYTTNTVRRIWDPKKKRYTKWMKAGGRGITTKRPYAYKYELIRQA